MAISFGFFTDPALTTPLTRPVSVFLSMSDTSFRDSVLYFGSPVSGRVLKASSSPGVDSVSIAVVAAMGGLPSDSIRLALAPSGLSSAVPGAPLGIGTEVPSKVAVAIHFRVSQIDFLAGSYDNLSLEAIGVSEYKI